MPSLADFGAPYPAAAPGQERKVIYLPPMHPDMEQDHMRVQLIPGRNEDCEDGRLYHLTGTISEGEVEGWGYPYYVVTLGDIYAAHRTPADSENATSFVAMYENPMLNYNSKLPIVVYVPEGAEVRYRVWMDEAGRSAEPVPSSSTAAPAPQHQTRDFDMDELDDGRHDHAGTEQEDAYPAEEKAEAAHPQQEAAYPEPAAARGIPAYEEHYAETRPLQAQEAAEHHRGIPALSNAEVQEAGQQHEYVEEAEAAPVLRGAEKKPREVGETAQPAQEAPAEERQGHRKSGEPGSEHRRRSSSKPRKHSASETGERKHRERGLSATELSPAEETAAPKSATEKAPSSSNNKRHSVERSRNESTNSGRRSSVASSKDKKEEKEKKEDKDAYEKKAKNFWNRARGNSKSKESSPKKANGKADQWSEM